MPDRLIPLRLYYVACFAMMGIYLPFFPRWLEARGIDGFAMGAVSAIMPAMGVLGPPLFGLLADALALRGVLLRLACAGAALAFTAIASLFLLGYAPGVGVLFLLVLVFGLFRSPMIMIADVVAMEQAERGATTYARIRLYGSLGFLVAALLAGRFLDLTAAFAFPVSMAATLFAALLFAWPLPTRSVLPPVPSSEQARALVSKRSYRLFLLILVFAQAAHASYDLCFSLHLRDLGAPLELAGAAWAIGVACEVVLMAFSPALFARVSAKRLLALAIFAAIVRWILIASLRSVPLLCALQPLHALSFGLMWISSLDYVKKSAPAQALATAQGLSSASYGAGSVLGMLIWGALYRRLQGPTTFAVAALVSGIAFALCLLWNRDLRPGQEKGRTRGQERRTLRHFVA